MIKVTIKTQGKSKSKFNDIKDFSCVFSDDAKLKEVTEWIDSTVKDKRTVMGASIKPVK